MSAKATKIIGVDFSGAKYDNATAVTEAVLQGKELTVESCILFSGTRESAHYRLEQLLRKLPDDSVVAMDFPFSVPKAFAEKFAPNSSAMPVLWYRANAISYNHFNELPYVIQHSKELRLGDRELSKPSAKAPLRPHDMGSPTMRAMTFFGMQLLHRLWIGQSLRFNIPPLDKRTATGPVLLETYPGTVLSDLDLKYQGYKNLNNDEPRREILLGLVNRLRKNGLRIELPEPWQGQCIGHHDCLDSLVAAIVAALWKKDKSCNKAMFRTPSKAQLPNAKLEGWIYVPKHLSIKEDVPDEGLICPESSPNSSD